MSNEGTPGPSGWQKIRSGTRMTLQTSQPIIHVADISVSFGINVSRMRTVTYENVLRQCNPRFECHPMSTELSIQDLNLSRIASRLTTFWLAASTAVQNCRQRCSGGDEMSAIASKRCLHASSST